MENTKPIKVRPAFYAHCFNDLNNIARRMGYALLLHGSMNRDMDLVAVPWVMTPYTHHNILDAFAQYLGVLVPLGKDGLPDYLYTLQFGNRYSYVINLNRGGRWNSYQDDPQYYLDISFTPALVDGKVIDLRGFIKNPVEPDLYKEGLGAWGLGEIQK